MEWAAGTPTMVIAERLKRSKSSIIGRAYRLGLDYHPNAGTALPEDMSQDWADYQAGRTDTSRIARKYGVTPYAIIHRFKREGWPRRSRSEYARLNWRNRKAAMLEAAE